MESLVSRLAAVHPQSSGAAHLQTACRRVGARRRVLGHRGVLVHGSVGRRHVTTRGVRVAHLVGRGCGDLSVVLECDLDGRELSGQKSEVGGGDVTQEKTFSSTVNEGFR